MDNLLALPNGTVLAGDYRLECVLGAGGFGITYLADELALHRKVAIKEYFPGEFATRDGASQVRHRSESDGKDYAWGLERFIEEAQTLARFDHGNIVRVYRYFRANNTAYMVLQFEEGQSLRQWIDSLKKAPAQDHLDAIVAPVLDALELIHGNDFLHRDIAADNILIRRDGSPVLIDFGSARGDVASHTKTLSALVKPGYSPFEQYASNGKQQGPWTDIYALAATLYLAVTGVRPPDAPSRITADEFVPASRAARGNYRPAFLAAIDRALEIQIDRRPRSIAVWRHELFGNDAAARQHNARPVAATIRATRKIETKAVQNLVWKKNRAPPPAAGGVGGGSRLKANGGAVAGGLAMAGTLPGRMLAGGRAGALRVMHGGRAGFAAAGGAVAEVAVGARAMAAKAAGMRPRLPQKPSLSLPSLAGVENFLSGLRLRRKADPTRARRSLIKALEDELARPLPKGEKHKGKDGSNAGEKLAAKPPKPRRGRLFKSGVWRREKKPAEKANTAARDRDRAPRAARNTGTRRTGLRRGLWYARMSARLAAIVGFVAFLVWQQTPGDPVVAAWSRANPPATTSQLGLVKTLRGHSSAITSLAVSDDGLRIATASREGRNVIWNARSGREVRSLDSGSAGVNAIDMAGDQLVMAQANGALTIWNVRTGKLARTFKRQKGSVLAAVFAGKSTQLYSAGDDQRLRIWNTRRGSWRSLRGHKGSVTALAVSADGKTLVSGGSDSTVKLWNVKRGKVIKTLHSHDKAITAVAVAPSGMLFASGSADESIRIYPDRGNGEIKTLYGHGSTITALAFSPSGRLLASASADHAVKLWNAETGALIHTFVGHTDAVNALAFMPDGRRLVTASADKTVRIWRAQVAGFR